MIEKKILAKVQGIEIGLAESSFAGRFTQEELAKAFKLVQNKEHWKGPIDAIIHESDKDVVSAAIEHFTATEASFEIDKSLGNGDISLRVTAPGYWAGPAN